MISILASMSASLIMGLPANAVRGVWISEDNQTVWIMEGPSAGRAIVNEQFITIMDGKEAPDGTYFGSWYRAKLPGVISGGSWRPPQKPREYAIRDNYPDVPSQNGSYRFYFKQFDNNGYPTISTLAYFIGNNSASEWSKTVYFAIPVSKIAFGEDYSSLDAGAYVKLDSRSSQGLAGTINVGGRTYNVEGLQSTSLLELKLIDRSTGDQVGTAFLKWAPTAGLAASYRKGEAPPTDRVFARIKTPFKDLSVFLKSGDR